MLSKLAVLRVLLATYAAQMRFVTRVYHHVNGVCHFLRESLVAHGARERAFARVNAAVVYQLGVSGEGFGAHFARKWPFT